MSNPTFLNCKYEREFTLLEVILLAKFPSIGWPYIVQFPNSVPVTVLLDRTSKFRAAGETSSPAKMVVALDGAAHLL